MNVQIAVFCPQTQKLEPPHKTQSSTLGVKVTRPFHQKKILLELQISRSQMPNILLKPRANGCNIVGCYMLRPFTQPVACCCALLGVVARSLKPGNRLATCKQTQQLPTLLGQQVGSCCVRFQVAWHFISLYLAQGIVCPSPARTHRVQHFPLANQLRQHC